MAEFGPSNTPPTDEVRAPGMDHAHYPFRTLPEAPRFAWPDGARIAFTVTVMLDYWELEPPQGASADPRIGSPLGRFSPDWLTWSHREYGARVGIFRVLDVLDRFGVTPSVALGSAAARRYPELVDELMRRNTCFLAHGSHATRRITSRMSEAEERTFIAEARDAVAAAAGEAPLGWCGQDFNESARTPALLASAGFTYATDWPNDDRPYLLGPYDGRHVLALPPQPEWNDLECMWLRRVNAPVWADGIAEAFAVLHEEGGAVFNLTLHPWIAGQAHRIRWLREALGRVLGKPHVWRTTTDEVARVARQQLEACP
jgi:peptidoglycan/xylan/chitin deacetylase (PgdA/CDA1 family)